MFTSILLFYVKMRILLAAVECILSYSKKARDTDAIIEKLLETRNRTWAALLTKGPNFSTQTLGQMKDFLQFNLTASQQLRRFYLAQVSKVAFKIAIIILADIADC